MRIGQCKLGLPVTHTNGKHGTITKVKGSFGIVHVKFDGDAGSTVVDPKDLNKAK